MLKERKLDPFIRRIYDKSVAGSYPFLAAVALWLLTRTLNGGGDRRILFVGSAASLEDLHALARYSGRYQYLYLQRFYFGRILRKYITDPGLREDNYYTNEEYIEGRKRTNELVGAVFAYLKKMLRIDAVMTSNLGYMEQQELFTVARRDNFPTIVLLREGMVHPAKAASYFRVYDNKQATCDLFLCYNDVIRSSILKQEVPGLTGDIMKTTGLPRCDFYVREDNYEPDDQVVFFTFNADVKFKNILPEGELLEAARKVTLDFCRHVFTVAEERPGIKVICKTKPSAHYIEEMENTARRHYQSTAMPDNLMITSEGEAKDLVLGSRWVLGIGNSTTLLEALLANRKTACPDYRHLVDARGWDFVNGEDALVSYIVSLEDMLAFVDDRDENGPAASGDVYYDVLNRFLYSTDGKASERVEKYISELWPRH